jgi:hypothetical protein
MSFEPSWKHLTTATGGLFIAILAFLGGRVALGADNAVPAVAQTTTQTTQQQTTTQQTTTQQQQQAPVDPNPPSTHSS